MYGAITTHELCPPNPKELEIAAATQQGKKQGENEIFGDLKKIKIWEVSDKILKRKSDFYYLFIYLFIYVRCQLKFSFLKEKSRNKRKFILKKC